MAKRLSLFFGLFLASCAGGLPRPPGPLIVLAVGENTVGLGGGSESWPSQLEQVLAPFCPGVKVKSWSVPGGDSSDAAALLPAGLSIHKPRALVAMLGVNEREGLNPRHLQPKRDDGDDLLTKNFNTEHEFEATLLERMRKDPWNDRRFVSLFARRYRDSGRVDEELQIMREIVGQRPWNPWALAELGTLLRLKGQFNDAENLHRRAFESVPNEAHILQEWLADFRDAKEFDAAYREALKLTKNHRPADFVAASFYLDQNLRQKHEQVMRKIVGEGCESRKCLEMLRVALLRNGKRKEAEAIKLPEFSEPIGATKANLAEIAREAASRGVALFLMQYPLMPPEDLERLAIGPVDIIPNQNNFRVALDRLPYEQLFADRFFGEAARLVAESAASHLLPWARERGYCR